jgi:hypothetical protein
MCPRGVRIPCRKRMGGRARTCNPPPPMEANECPEPRHRLRATPQPRHDGHVSGRSAARCRDADAIPILIDFSRSAIELRPEHGSILPAIRSRASEP